jgi:CheY-like chemotaxis protein
MKLDYNILWVDDRIKERPFQKILGETKGFLLEEYFNCNIIEAEDFKEFVEIFSTKKEFDIIITDYSLNEGTFGNQVIDFIRDSQHNFTEIFFYSANENVKDIKLFSNNRITFFQLTGGDYKELENEILEVINQTIKKFQNIVTMRGMIMHETSSLDLKMEEIVRKQLKNPNLEEHIKPLLDTIFDNIFANAKEKYEKAGSRKVKDILRDNVLFNASQKIYALGAILEIMKEENFAPNYNDEVILIRNQFAHSELKMDDDGKEYFKVKGEDIYFDKELCKKIRRDLNEYIKKINAIENKINV